ncbi:tyrosine-type recombinase/integrase [Sunxiuqinia sp. A32]|uniref:tyrosine-type recombinase/integrase n=1 Tax=Sunxiuqinia sp. A32 TaxID=3461496 RepID=UPI004045DC04
MGATISIFLDTREEKSDGLYPLKIRATYDRKRRYFGIPKEKVNTKLSDSKLEPYRYDGKGNFSIKKDLYEKIMSPKARMTFKELQIVFKGIELDAQKKADSLTPFTFDGFKNQLTIRQSRQNKVFSQFEEMIQQLKDDDRIGTANSYTDAKNSLKKFASGKEVQFEYFTVDRLSKYQSWMERKGNSDTTTGMYLRALRALFNSAKKNGITNHYPFGEGDNKFTIPKGGGRKIALERQELEAIFNYSLPEKHPYSFFLDSWKLMYLLGGLNPIDLCLLKENNIHNGFIYFVRQKTKRTAKRKKEINIPYSGAAKAIIEKWKYVNPDEPFMLPVLKKDMTASQVKEQTKKFVKSVNTAMKHIAPKLGIEKRITTYVSRHSIATQLLRAGAPVKMIGDQLGHHDTKTTEAYLEGFEDDQIKEVYKQAIKF